MLSFDYLSATSHIVMSFNYTYIFLWNLSVYGAIYLWATFLTIWKHISWFLPHSLFSAQNSQFSLLSILQLFLHEINICPGFFVHSPLKYRSTIADRFFRSLLIRIFTFIFSELYILPNFLILAYIFFIYRHFYIKVNF